MPKLSPRTILANHSIRYLSPSSVNLFIEERGHWCLRYLLKHPTPAGISAMRGRVCESAIRTALSSGSRPAKIASKTLTSLQKDFGNDPDWEKEVVAIPAIAEAGYKALKPFGTPLSQGKVSLPLEGVPFVGYYDFLWPDKFVDLKCSLKKSFRRSHLRQIAIYNFLLRRKCGICNATPTKAHFTWPTQAELDDALDEVRAAVQSLVTFLSLSNDPKTLTKSQMPNYESFYWSSPVSRSAGGEVFGF